jgi:hypothetical protein
MFRPRWALVGRLRPSSEDTADFLPE